MMETMGQRLRRLRMTKGLKQKDVAAMLNCRRATYTNYENDARCLPIEFLRPVADLYGITVDDLLYGGENVTSAPDLDELMRCTEVVFAGEPRKLDDAGREKLRQALEFAFWQADAEHKGKG